MGLAMLEDLLESQRSLVSRGSLGQPTIYWLAVDLPEAQDLSGGTKGAVAST